MPNVVATSRKWPLSNALNKPFQAVTHKQHGRLLRGAIVCCIGVAGGTPESEAAQQRPTTQVESCASAECHASYATRKVRHPSTVECLMCHSYASPQQHLFTLKAPRRELCTGCHLPHRKVSMHQPYTEGDCLACHDPHGSDFPKMMVSNDGQRLCGGCHKNNYAMKSHVHGPVAIGACTICHESHSSGNAGLLRYPRERLCLECHAEFEPRGVEARHKHKPLEDGCGTCHDPHATDNRYQLHEPVNVLCFTCHNDVSTAIKTAVVTHGPAADPGGCVECHNPHFTRLPRLQRQPQPDVCLRCHDKELQARDGRTLTNMLALLTENPDHHGPIREGACTGCHQPHAGQRFGMLYQEYPKEFYAPYSAERYQLCFSCHMSDMVKDPGGTGLTGFRDGDLNLHWLHVNREKGRTCRACHEVHASKRPFHIREEVPFGPGGWLLPIKFERTENGGTCLPGCHRDRDYDRTRQRGATPEDVAASKGSPS